MGGVKRTPGRKPVDLEPRHRGLTTREAIWSAVRRLITFSTHDIRGELTGATSLRTIQDYLRGLERAGYLAIEGHVATAESGYPRRMYRLVRDVGVDAPRVNEQGVEYEQGRSRERIWAAIKVLKDFSVIDLSAVIAGLDAQAAREYLRYLHKAGYLVMVSSGRPGNRPGAGERARYRIVPARCRGARAPILQRTKRVYDPNLGRVVWPDGCAT